MKRSRLPLSAVCCLSLLVLLTLSLGAASAQSIDNMGDMMMEDDMMMDDSMMIMPPDTCGELPGHIMVSSDTMGVQCQVVDGGGIGIKSIVDAGVLAAVDVWGPLGVHAEVCFTSSGSVTFLDATTAPRTQMTPSYAMRDGMTCTNISHPGTVILMPSMMMDDMMTDDMMTDDMMMEDDMAIDDVMTIDDAMMMDDEMAMADAMMMEDDMAMEDDMMMDDDMMDEDPLLIADSMDSMVYLDGCHVTALYNLNFRAEPAGDIIGIVASESTKAALARTSNWFKVEHRDAEGWITAHYIEGEGECG